MKKLLLSFASVTLISCATSKRMMLPSGQYGHSVSCDGTALKWEQCFEKAAEVCPHGYNRIDKSQSSGTSYNIVTGFQSQSERNMLIQCKSADGRAVSAKPKAN